MTRNLGLAVAAILAVAVSVSACGGGGAESETNNEIRTTTIGQELQDLKKALDQGAISREEYEAERKKILDRE